MMARCSFHLCTTLCLTAFVLTACCSSVAIAQHLLFSDGMSSGAGWQFSHFGGSGKPGPTDISEADFGFDYSAFGIPEAPNSQPGDAATQGLRLAANIPGNFGGDQIAAVYEHPSFTGQYTVQVDAWVNWSPHPTFAGTTEHVGVLAGFTVADAQASLHPGRNGAGVLFDGDGDGGCSANACDYMLVKSGAAVDLASGQYGESSFGGANQPGYSNTNSNGNLNLQALFPSFDIATATGGLNATGTQPAGALGFQWVVVTLEVDTTAPGNGTNGRLGTVKVSLESTRSGNSFVLGTIDNSVDDDPFDGVRTQERPVNLEGGIGLMMTDIYNGAPSNPSFGFGLFDNVRVYQGLLSDPSTFSTTVPEPSVLLLALLAMLLGTSLFSRGHAQ